MHPFAACELIAREHELMRRTEIRQLISAGPIPTSPCCVFWLNRWLLVYDVVQIEHDRIGRFNDPNETGFNFRHVEI